MERLLGFGYSGREGVTHIIPLPWNVRSLSLVATALAFLSCHIASDAPTAEIAESPKVLAGVHGTVVAADGEKRLLVVDLPSGKLTTVSTLGPAIAASALGHEDRIAYVRRIAQPLDELYSQRVQECLLILKSVADGSEKKIATVRGSSDGFLYALPLRGKHLLYLFAAQPPRLFNVEDCSEYDLGRNILDSPLFAT